MKEGDKILQKSLSKLAHWIASNTDEPMCNSTSKSLVNISRGARRKKEQKQIPPERPYRQMWAAMWVPGIKPRSLGGAVHALDYGDISSARGSGPTDRSPRQWLLCVSFPFHLIVFLS